MLQPGQTVALTSSAASGYLWSTGETTKTIVVSTAGTYTVRAYAAAGCFSLSLPVIITESTTGVGNIESTNNFSALTVYPNPAREQVTFNYIAETNQDAELIVFDIAGREMSRSSFHAQVGENKLELNVFEYPRGMYFTCIQTKTEKLIIRLILN